MVSRKHSVDKGVTRGVPGEGRVGVLAPADEVDDLQTVAVAQAGLGPLLAGNDFPVKFYGNAVALHAELFD
jgi:hypothetical protein